MPYERTGKNRKLSRPYFGPYRVMEVHLNGVTVRPVDRPKDNLSGESGQSNPVFQGVTRCVLARTKAQV